MSPATDPLSAATPAGSRLRCSQCGSEAIVMKANEPVIVCCGQPLQTVFSPAAKPTEG